MEDTHETPKNELPQNNEVVSDDKDFLDLLGSNRGRFKSEKNEEPTTHPKRGDGGDLL